MEARQRRAPKAPAPVTPIVLGILGGLVVLFFMIPFAGAAATRMAAADPSVTAKAAYYGGALLVGATVATALWALIHFAFIRASRPRWGLPVLGLQLVVTVGAALVLSGLVLLRADEKVQMRTAAAEMQRVVGGFMDDGLKTDVGDTRPRARGEAGEVERTVKESYADILLSARAYETDIRAMGLADMTPARLARADLGAVIGNIARAKVRTVAYRSEIDTKIAAFRKRIEDSALSPAHKQAYLDGFDRGYGAQRGRTTRLLDLQEELLDLSEQQIRFLQLHRRGWVVQNNIIAFRSQADMRAFNVVARRIATVNAEIRALQADQRSRMEGFERDLGEQAAGK